MLKRIFGGTKATSIYPSELVEYYQWLQRLPEQEIVGEPNSQINNPITTWLGSELRGKHEVSRIMHPKIEHGKIHWGIWNGYSGFDKYSRDTESWMGRVLSLAGKRSGKVTAGQALEDCTALMNEIAQAQQQSQAVATTEDGKGLLSTPKIDGQQQQDIRKMKLVCWYCKRNVPNNIPRSVMNFTEERTSSDRSATSTVRIITFVCPHCNMENEQQVDMQGQVTIRETPATE